MITFNLKIGELYYFPYEKIRKELFCVYTEKSLNINLVVSILFYTDIPLLFCGKMEYDDYLSVYSFLANGKDLIYINLDYISLLREYEFE